MAEHARPIDDIDRAASSWLARRRLGPLSSSEESEFQAWLDASPSHAAGFAEMSLTLNDVASLTHLGGLAPVAPSRPRPRATIWGGGIAAALAVFFAAPALLDRPDIEASTLVGEVRPITLPDGTKVTLGAKSQIKVRFSGAARRVELTGGEAFFEIAEDRARPFLVEAGGTVIRDIGTKFDVKRLNGRVEVGVLEGEVEVQPTQLLPGDAPTRRLMAGERMQARTTGLAMISSAKLGAVQPSATQAGAWRDGQLTYDDTPLAEVVADLNRYYGPGVTLDSESLGDVRLAAAFKVGEIDKFLQELPSVAPVTVRREKGGGVIIAPLSRAGEG